MPRVRYGQSQKVGMSPGSAVYTGQPSDRPVRITVYDFTAERFEERGEISVEDCARYATSKTTTWIDIDGVHDAALVQRVCEAFGVHPLTIEDVLSIGTRPKCEEYESYLFIVLALADVVEEAEEEHGLWIDLEQVSVLIGHGWVLTFQQDPGDVWDPVRRRLQAENGRLRQRGADYLGYTLLDSAIDHYFLVLEDLGAEVEALEDIAFEHADQDILDTIHGLRRHLMLMRKTIAPLRDVTGVLMRSDSKLIQSTTRPYLRDLHDHVLQAVETVEIYREASVSVLELYLAGGNNRMNQVMKLLTMIATIFIPMTFVSSVYGMNFTYMPETKWVWGYPAAVLMMAAVAVVMLVWFKRQRWF